MVMAETKEHYSYCNICGYRTIFEGQRKSLCPICHSLERHRHLYIYLLAMIPFLNGKKILHFAPEKNIKDILKSCEGIDYYDADITPGRASHAIDIKNITFQDNFFDYILAVHVMEHIDDDEQAFREIYRTLKPGGEAILVVPFMHQYHKGGCLRADNSIMNHLFRYDKDKTFEIPGRRTPQECFELYGQSDHLRIYGREDFCERLKKQNFTVRVSRAESLPEKLRLEAKIIDDIVFAQK